jgi:hypothetical protein
MTRVCKRDKDKAPPKPPSGDGIWMMKEKVRDKVQRVREWPTSAPPANVVQTKNKSNANGGGGGY